MSVPLQQYSEEQIGHVWTIESHMFLCHVLAEIESTWRGVYDSAMGERLVGINDYDTCEK